MVSDCSQVPVMVDALLAIASDPFQAMMSSVFLFALGMYPLGLMLGSSCSACCQQNPCSLCTEGSLPDTITVTFDNLPNQTRSDDLLRLGFSSCFGSGATARILDPGGEASTAAGPIASVSVTGGGSGYARLARVQPELVLTASGNGDAGFSISLSETEDTCGLPAWSVEGVEITKAGTGYKYGSIATFTAKAGTTQIQPAAGTVFTRLQEPEATLSIFPGSGGVFNPSFVPSLFVADRWELDSVQVSGSGTGYIDGTFFTIAPSVGTTTDWQASARLNTERDEPAGLQIVGGFSSKASGYSLTPVLTKTQDFEGLDYWEVASVTIDEPGTEWQPFEALQIQPGSHVERFPFYAIVIAANQEPTLQISVVSGSGSNAVLSASLSETLMPDGSAAWEIASVTVANSGSGYLPSDTLQVTASQGRQLSPFSGGLVLGESGAIEGVNVVERGQFAIVGVLQEVLVYSPGYYFIDTGIPESVTVQGRGSYYSDTGEVDRVEVAQPGRYYKEDASGTPYAADVTVVIEQALPSQGTGASFAAVIDTSPGSPTFGQITAVNVTNGGDGYLAWVWRNSRCCGDYWNGKTVVLRRNANSIFLSSRCNYVHTMCITGPGDFRSAAVRFEYLGPATPPKLYISSAATNGLAQSSCSAEFLTTENVTDCSSIDLEMTSADGATAAVIAGGDYDPFYRYPESGVVSESFFSSAVSRSCHTCCKGEDAVPGELEATVTDNSDSEFNISGTYVLSFRAGPIVGVETLAQPGYRFLGFVSQLNRSVGVDIRWSVCADWERLDFTSRRPSVQASYLPLNLSLADGSLQCDECHNKCVVSASAFIAPSVVNWVEQREFSSSLTCQDFCESTPICNLQGRSFSMCNSGLIATGGLDAAKASCGQLTIQT